MNPRQRTPQPLERAVTKALARQAQRRAEKLATEHVSSQPQSLEPQTPEPQHEHAPNSGAERSAVVQHPAAELTAQPVAVATPVSIPAAKTRQPEEQPEHSAEPPSTRAALPAETMSMIERLAARGPFADAGGSNVEREGGSNSEREGGSNVEREGGSNAEKDSQAEERQPATPVAAPAIEQAAKAEPVTEAAPARRAAGGGAPLDAFQLLLSSNPDAGDNTRNDLPDAPDVRNPRKALAADPGIPESPSITEADPDKPREATSDSDVNDEETPEKERSLRNWFSPKSDPNPPPAPESDPLRD